jgi:polysaccharide chain length determinant protein (PEP-CTERM system associated)
MIIGRRWLILVPFALGLAVAPALSTLEPKKYRSETLIMVVPQRVPDSYVKSTITESIEDRLPSISDQILSRSRLERIILDFDLYREERGRQVMEDVVARMRNDITFGLEGKNVDSFRVAYVSHQAEMARKVTERLASLYIEQNLRDRETQADSTSQFLETELAQAKQRLVEHEKKLEEYRRRNAGQLPNQLQGNLQAMQNANLELQAIRESTNRSLERRLLIERQIADAQALPVVPAPPIVLGAPAPEPTDLREQLEAAKARLETFMRRFTPDHPDVVTLQRLIGDLQARVAAQPSPGTSTEVPEKALSADELAREKRVRELQAELAVIEHHLTGNRADEERLQRVIADYQAKIDVLPTRESELVELTRDYGTLQTAYSSLLMKREEAKIAANLERRQIGEQFRILDPASLPEKPYNELRRLAITGSGAIAGFIFGLLIVGLLELRDSSFRREEEVLRALEIPVLALIPVIVSSRESRSHRRASRLMDLAGTIVLLAVVTVIAYWQLSS